MLVTGTETAFERVRFIARLGIANNPL